MQHRPLKRRHSTSNINDHDDPGRKRQKLLASVLKQLQQTAEEVRCALNDATWLDVEERVRAALVIDHVAGMSRMMEEDYEFGDEDEEMEEDSEEEYEDTDGDGNEDDAGDVIEEVVRKDPESPVIKGMSGFVEENDENEGRGWKEGVDEDGEKEDENSYSSWLRRGVSFSARVTCTTCTESEDS